MGKSKKKGSNRASASGKPSKEKEQSEGLSLAEIQILEKAESKLKAGLTPFQQGDFVAARALFQASVEDNTLDSNTQQRAAELLDATRPERTAVLVGAACAVMLVLITLVSQLTQP